MHPEWQIRDVKHGKVFSFESFEKMLSWLVDKTVVLPHTIKNLAVDEIVADLNETKD